MSAPDEKNVNIPVVGVIIPLHNHKDFIGKCLDSVEMQDYPNKFAVVIDDNSDDGGYDHVLSLLENEVTEGLPEGVRGGYYGNLYTLVLKNESDIHGPSIARNIGIQAVWDSTHFFGVLDADDEYLPGKLSKSVTWMIQDPILVGLVYSDVVLFDTKTEIGVHEFRPSFDREQLEVQNIISNAPLINKLALQQVGLYDIELRTCEDWDLWLRITEKFVALHIPEPLQIYRITGFNATQTVDEAQWQKDWRTVQRKRMERKSG
jgi:glycosyltransferase involved in cell wall biosynthesis